MSTSSKRYASVNHPTINAVVHALFCLPREALAREKLDTIRDHFIISARQLSNEAHPCVHLWIKGYEVTPEQKEKGVIGNYALISYQQTGEGKDCKWVLNATRLDMPASAHPQRAQVKRDNPNWGHPVLRSIRKGRRYATLEEAQDELNLLHRQFPKVSIPNMGKLFIMIYCCERPPKERMVKHILKIKLQPDATYLIECKENMPRELRGLTDKKPKKPVAKPDEQTDPKGYFTARVALGRHMKGKPRTTAKPSDTQA